MKQQKMSPSEICRILRGSNFFTVTGSREMRNKESIDYFENDTIDKEYKVLINPSYHGVHLLIWE